MGEQCLLLLRCRPWACCCTRTKGQAATELAKLAELPDLTGIWYPDWRALFGQRRVPPSLTPDAKAKQDAFNAKYKDSGPPLYAQAHCLPPGA